MIRAASAIFQEMYDHFLEAGHAVILAGPGNNGGDGLVLASLLDEAGWSVDIWAWNRKDSGDVPLSEDALERVNWVDSLDHLGESLAEADVVIDAIFGAGGRAELPDDVGAAFERVRSQQSVGYVPVWAIDAPSGIAADTGETAETALNADITLMVGLPKIGLYRQPAASVAGQIYLVDIGLTSAVEANGEAVTLLTADLARRSLRDRRAGIHKRSAGTVMVIGGSPNYYGAPRLSGEAAMRAGAGLVSIAAPSSIIAPIATAVPELTFLPLPVSEHARAGVRMAEIVGKQIDDFDSLVIGPGLGTDSPTPEFLSHLLGIDQPASTGIGFGTFAEPDPVEPFAGRAVIDADGLNWLATVDEWWTRLTGAELVLTPHAGELARLLKKEREDIESDPWESAKRAAKQFQQTVVLKHSYTVVASPDGSLFVAEHAPVGLATAGTGDVLAGIIGSLLGQGLSPIDAALAGVAIGTEAALILQEEVGLSGYLAGDLIKVIPEARELIRQSRPILSQA
jgi:ADP-dependent NAD(P)H-hydrate dehydratase / NAD(P)H-hydrate epimerase